MTEGSVRRGTSIASLVQGYMEQFKSIKFAADTSNALPVLFHRFAGQHRDVDRLGRSRTRRRADPA